MKENNKNKECTEIPGIAVDCARSHSLPIFQQSSAMITLRVRSFAGSKFLTFEFDLDDNVSDVKEKIAKSPLCKGVKPMLEYNGLELADGRTLSYYGVKEPGVLRICE